MLYFDLYNKDDNYTNATIQGKDFADFLDICLEYSDFFTLTDHLYKRVRSDLLNALLPYCIGALKTAKWFGYNYMNASDPYEYREMMVYFFKPAPEVRDLITRHIDDVFFGHCEPQGPIYDNPKDCPIKGQNLEDMLFFKDGRTIIYSICHESIPLSHSKDEDFLSKLRKIGTWGEREMFPQEEEWIHLENTVPGIDKLIDFSRLCRTENASDPKTS